MDYKRIYEQITAKDMDADYTERHHIIPRCMGGTDDPSNLVRLTPEAHYVAHQLLVKIYPNNNSLAHAAKAMTMGNKRNNKLYGWLRHRHSIALSNMSEETRAKIGAASKGRLPSNETRAKLSAAKKGKTPSEETRAKMSAARKGKPKSEEHIAKIGAANKGKTPTAEAKAKMSAAKKGKTPSEETRAKMSAANKGFKHSEETRAKISAASKGKPKSEEHIAKMSAAKRNLPVLTCPHCNKSSNGTIMTRWHFDNCKQKVK